MRLVYVVVPRQLKRNADVSHKESYNNLQCSMVASSLVCHTIDLLFICYLNKTMFDNLGIILHLFTGIHLWTTL